MFQTGHIFVFTGLMKNVPNDDQLAVVLGHEMAHALLGHGVSVSILSGLFTQSPQVNRGVTARTLVAQR